MSVELEEYAANYLLEADLPVPIVYKQTNPFTLLWLQW